ncbi:hypothetical protein DHEL01_v206052 [Diaporthe helianthi]|uniref:Uncharacterized protein n=1 Tax=Diaporthe helianthi TaxID=158607 RepID=A0A2P5HZ62_DIAHE|nr:hypothetical protein DHEL01_v206052 [Diaporthe helianthi]
MQTLGKARTTVALQSMQFGEDQVGEQRLQYLDDNLEEELNLMSKVKAPSPKATKGTYAVREDSEVAVYR